MDMRLSIYIPTGNFPANNFDLNTFERSSQGFVRLSFKIQNFQVSFQWMVPIWQKVTLKNTWRQWVSLVNTLILDKKNKNITIEWELVFMEFEQRHLLYSSVCFEDKLYTHYILHVCIYTLYHCSSAFSYRSNFLFWPPTIWDSFDQKLNIFIGCVNALDRK